MPRLGLAPYLLLLLALSAHSARQIIRCNDIPTGVQKITATLSAQICAAGNNDKYLQKVFINGGDARNVSLYEIIRGDASEDRGFSCHSLASTTIYIYNNNAKKDCSDDFFLFMEDERVAAVAVTHDQRITQINLTDERSLLLLSPTGRIKLEFLQGKENVASIRAGSNSGSRTIYNVNYKVKIPDTYVLYGSLIQIVPRNMGHFTFSLSADILDERILSPGSFVVVGTFAYPDARHLNGKDDLAVFKMNESVQVDTLTNCFFDKQYHGGVQLIAGGHWFNGSRLYSGAYNNSDEFSYDGARFGLRYLTIVPPDAQALPNNDYFTTEVHIRKLPSGLRPRERHEQIDGSNKLRCLN